MIEVKQYKDHDGNTVRVGDEIEQVMLDEQTKYMGVVTKILKGGFYIHPETTLTTRKEQLWGKFTRKITKDKTKGRRK